MPHRLEPVFGTVITAIGAFCSGCAAVPFLGSILDNNALLFVCILGSIGGALVSILFWPPKSADLRLLSAKFLASGVCAMIFAPWISGYIIEHWSFKLSADLVMMVSGVLGLCAFSFATLVRRLVIKKAAKYLGLDEEEYEKRIARPSDPEPSNSEPPKP